MSNIRVGFGYDVHTFSKGRELILGGISIPYSHGLMGHSDADALLHAITDALLGAVALGDIGTHFPDTDPAYKNADSAVLLQKAYALVRKKGYRFCNADVTVVCEKPKLKPFIPAMQRKIANLLGSETDTVSVKATTSEKMGFAGRGEGVAVHAVVLVEKSVATISGEHSHSTIASDLAEEAGNSDAVYSSEDVCFSESTGISQDVSTSSNTATTSNTAHQAVPSAFSESRDSSTQKKG